MRYDAPTGEVVVTGAGHENLLIWRHARREIEVQKTGGMVLGLTTRAEEQFQERRLDLQPGDGLVLYTDGVTEALNEQREQFLLERLVESARRHAHQPPKQALHSILGDVLRFKGRATQRDDITLVVVKRSRPGEPPPAFPEEEPTRLGIRR
jgi:sigma-B regulation protein RsbU (phosphoserine phosphatase)